MSALYYQRTYCIALPGKVKMPAISLEYFCDPGVDPMPNAPLKSISSEFDMEV